MASVQGE